MIHSVKTVFLFLALFPATLGPLCHPQDGPDVDLRVHIQQSQMEVQAIVNLAFCDEILGQLRDEEQELHPDEEGLLKKELLATFRKEVTVRIDGLEVSPEEQSCEVLPFEPGDAEFFPTMRMLAVIKVRVRLIYSLKTTPRSVALHWGMYPADLAIAEWVDSSIQINAEWTAGQETQIVPFTEQEPEFIWHAGKNGLAPRFVPTPEAAVSTNSPADSRLWLWPWGGLALLLGATAVIRRRRPTVGFTVATLLITAILSWLLVTQQPGAESHPPQLTDEEAVELFEVLHANIYRAFDFTEEEEIYDALSRSVEGDLLAQIYEQIYTSLIMQDQGGAVSRVKEVTPISTTVTTRNQDEPGSFRVRSRWRVLGQVYHWGHTHMRLNEHLAEMDVRWNRGAWHISSSRVLEQFRVENTTSEGNN